MSERLLDPDLRDAARVLNATGRLRAEIDPELYRAALKERQLLATFFHEELGWTLEVLEAAELVRLHKRRADAPADRGPWLRRTRGDGPLAPRTVLVCCALVCEQLWRRSRMSLRDLLQAIAQVCAAEADAGTLPEFPVVAAEGVSKQTARSNRQVLVDVLKLLVAEGTVTVDADLDQAVDDEDADLVVTASRERLAAKFSSLSPLLLDLASLPPDQHAAALSQGTLPDRTPSAVPDTARSIEDRRLRLLRRLADDPATDPTDDLTEGSPYLHTITGRDRALNLLTSLGYNATVRRDWWEVTDPSGDGSGITFPNGRRTERQAALALLAVFPRRSDPMSPLRMDEAVDVLEQARQDRPRWASAYTGRLAALARAAAAELVAVGLLRPDPRDADAWLPTPGIHLWRVKVRSGTGAKPSTEATPAAQDTLPLTDEDPRSTP
ncbi:hypothetical protein GCM10009678_31300 [Actinomadura kijaniata]|uniref:Uncharacterized protein (TIGR02678 family) n=1 Tax=Actinomadura namibiensis TaxID=182080 RepID=A0A7W3LIE5_ACTNM|nr:DUF2398 family protein [Actinomadura namibiensis]MBA8948727.1 uncharacterized protein (TIGR02678 family) [Actinomadura namibiensis]